MSDAKSPVPDEFTPGLSCPTLLANEREELVRYLRMTPNQRKVMLEAVVLDPRTCGPLIHAMRWLYTA